MIRNYLAAALRNLARNRLYAAISIVGLAIGMAAAILTGLYIRDETRFDHDIPGHEQVYETILTIKFPGSPTIHEANANDQLAGWIKLAFPRAGAFARITAPSQGSSVRRGAIEAVEQVAWVDPDFFKVVPLATVAGDLASALRTPDGVVLTRAMARKYFGKDAPIGEVLELDRKLPLRVTAVIEDRPAASSIDFGVYASGKVSTSPLALSDATPYEPGGISISGRLLARIDDPAQAQAINQALPEVIKRHMHTGDTRFWLPGTSFSFKMIPIGEVHLYPLTNGKNRGSLPVLYALGGIAALILLVAGVNFVNLMTARAARRAVEVGVRKAAGAARRDLIVQFLGEAVIYAAVAMVLAVGLAELVLPALNAVLLTEMRFTYWRDLELVAGVLVLTVLVGVLAGAYPALVLSGFRPALVLKGGAPATAGSSAVRSGLVVLQFAILITLVLSTVVIWRQTRFLLNEGLRADHDQVLLVTTDCRNGFAEQVKHVPGVLAASCHSRGAVDLGNNVSSIQSPAGRAMSVRHVALDPDFLKVYGMAPLAGRSFDRSRGADALPLVDKAAPDQTPRTVMLNQAAVTAMGLGSPAQAVGRSIGMRKDKAYVPAEIIGVVPDFGFNFTNGPVPASVFFVDPNNYRNVSIKLAGRDVPETLEAIDAVWRRAGEPRPIQRRFVDAYLQEVYSTTLRQAALVGALAAIAVFIAVLGLFGLAAFTAERRTKEIGVRKAMGASRSDILRLLLWQFTKPVLWANLIAWPLGWWAMDRWLHGFAYRVTLEPWFFAAAAAAALLIAWVTVLSHALRVSQAKPVGALRYE